ncbi:ribonucleotide reductase subunit alpha [Shewanella surugensis]|uniref:Ribonucleotide reductase subunit alpha n=1 Tax=Shewanella surugensis TaxID=212020 RepID=A0ABT0LH96_9GAMM|nr:ribonucleotide reductase subunit alpha [Shewanella surugensis]MCL1127076.1 ribonucleotide reductase subunit alpha [Shewanella surugensis]
MIKKFNDLLKMTNEHTQPQRLIFLFAHAEAKNSKKSKQHQQGTISPIMCVDKLPEELNDFAALMKEADAIDTHWNFIFIASVSGENGETPTTEHAGPYLNKMAHDIETGNDVGRYIIFDRDENLIELASH